MPRPSAKKVAEAAAAEAAAQAAALEEQLAAMQVSLDSALARAESAEEAANSAQAGLEAANTAAATTAAAAATTITASGPGTTTTGDVPNAAAVAIDPVPSTTRARLRVPPDLATPPPIPIRRPKGSAYTQFKIMDKMGLRRGDPNHRRFYLDIRAALRALIDRATLDLNIPWEHQDPRKVAALCGAAREQIPFLQRFHNDWVTVAIGMLVLHSRRAYQAKIGGQSSCRSRSTST